MRKFAILLVLLGATMPCAQAQPNGVTAELQVGQDQYLPDEDVPVKVQISNRSGQTVVLGTGKGWITFNVLGEHSYLVPKIGEMPVQAPFALRSGESVTREFNPTPYFDFRRPGRYILGATIRIPQWKQEITCKPAGFMVSEGVPLPLLGDLTFGVPPGPGQTNAPPEVRHYSLLKSSDLSEMRLYFRLTDKSGRTLRVFPLARMLSFGDPVAQMDRANNLHVLLQTGAKTFTYCVMDPNGNLLARQFHEYGLRRPSLHVNDDGQVLVEGGRRVLTWYDIPPPAAATAKTQ
jgi:hypothetical protein